MLPKIKANIGIAIPFAIAATVPIPRRILFKFIKKSI
jgi:hypothetical protein